MSNRFTDSMSTRSDAELVEIVHAASDDWQPEAVEAARIELAGRHLSAESVQTIEAQVQTNQLLASEPLPLWAKLLIASLPWLLIPGLVALYFYARYQRRGERRKARDVLVWFGYGWGFFLLSLVGVALLKAHR